MDRLDRWHAPIPRIARGRGGETRWIASLRDGGFDAPHPGADGFFALDAEMA
jgi:hypothetical protein